MIETITPTGARHLSLPATPVRRTAAGRRARLVALLGIVLLIVAAAFAGYRIYRQQQAAPAATAGKAPGAATAGVVPIPDLPPPDLLRPLTPEEALKANAERPVEAQPATPAQPFKLRADEISRLRAIDCLTQAIYYEAASEGVDGGRAVAQVVLNRVRHPGYPNTVCGVVYQGSDRTTGCQFTFTCDGSLARTPVAYLWNRSRLIAGEALAGRIFAPVGYATHYHADYVVPYWAASLAKVAVIGRHIFYTFRGSGGSRAAFRQGYAGVEPAVLLPTPEVITDSLDTLDNATAPTDLPPPIKVEEDRVEALAPSPVIKPVADTSKLEADLTRGQLILGEPAPPSGTRKKAVAESDCPASSTQGMRAAENAATRVGKDKPGC
ncbi:cell wall hydrolase [Sphingomonas humi]|uniref:Cell wall hydrolase SleB domain-containing protein n=1 Tax=Sphingomonas humi TaxID=335630 RepID=A0ABP7RQH8_9SPHN